MTFRLSAGDDMTTTMEFVEAELAQVVELSVFIDGVADIVEMTEADAIALRDALNKMFPPVVQQTPYYIQPPPAFPHDDRKWEITSADTRTFKPKVI